tara:strand:- start:151 stop:1359 length:1209 start_codon:yes stop_codon:yes gene_type:complete
VKRLIYFFFISITFYNCENEIDINSDWEEIPVLYAILDGGAKDDCNGNGILDQNDNLPCNDQYIRIQKSFLGEFPADQMAQESDSIYYSPNDILVWVEEMCNNNTDTISVELIQSDEKPDDGYFSSENHYYFKFSNPLKLYENGESGPKCQYKVVFLNPLSGKKTSGIVQIIKPIDTKIPTSLSGSRHGVLKEIPDHVANDSPISGLRIRPSENGKLYKFFLRFNYVEVDISTGEEKSLYVDWNFSPITATESQYTSGGTWVDLDFRPFDFFSFLASSIPENDNVYRYPKGIYFDNGTTPHGQIDPAVYFPCLEFHFEVLDLDLFNYLNSQLPSGLTQSRPLYSNIDNGFGLIASISKESIVDVKMSRTTNNNIATNILTKKLNFRCFDGINDISNLGYDCQ